MANTVLGEMDLIALWFWTTKDHRTALFVNLCLCVDSGFVGSSFCVSSDAVGRWRTIVAIVFASIKLASTALVKHECVALSVEVRRIVLFVDLCSTAPKHLRI